MQEMYAFYKELHHGWFYTDVYSSPIGVRVCGHEPTHVVTVREATDGEDWNSWAWWNNKRQEITMIFPSRVQVEICFPYGHKVAEDAGDGRLIPVMIEPVREYHA